MSTRSKGASRERSFEAHLWAHGYRTMRASASGQRISAERREWGIAGDFIALSATGSGLPHLIVEVGDIGKRLAVAFAELTAQTLPLGFVPCIARCVDRRWWFHMAPDDRHDDFSGFIDALRAT